MTVTSVPAPVVPADPTPSDASNTPGDAGPAGSGSGFATLLAGLHDPDGHGTPAPPAKGGDRSAPGDPKPGSATGPADPVILALLGALAGISPIDPTTPAALPTARVLSATTAPADASPATTTATLLAHATDAPAPGAAVPTAKPADPQSPAPAAVADATTIAAANVPALAGARPTQPDATAAGAPDGSPTGDVDPTVPAPSSAPAPKASTATNATNATSHPAANVPAPVPAASDASAAGATSASFAVASPIVRSDPAPKPDADAGNVMLTAATAAADHAPPAAPAAAATAAPAPSAPLPPPPADQLVAVMRPLHRGPDGTYQLRIEMRPPELGRVDLRVEMKDGVLHAAIHTEHSETADLVRAALDDLRSRLDADGVRSGQLTVDAHGAGTPGRDRQAPTPERLADGTTAVPEPTGATVPATTSDPDSLLDVRI